MRFTLVIASLLAATQATDDPYCVIDEANNEYGPNRCVQSNECSGSRTCSPWGWCQFSGSGDSGCPPPANDKCTIDESKNPMGPSLCDTDNVCKGARTCSAQGKCEGDSVCAEPKSDACNYDEAQNPLGPNRCSANTECAGARTCSPWGWCEGVSGCDTMLNLHQFKNSMISQKMNHFKDSDLPADASAQWYAGLLYAYTYQEVDKRDYIVGCSNQRDQLDAKLSKAYDEYNHEAYQAGNAYIQDTENDFRRSMTDCCDTNDYFHQMVNDAHDFFDLHNWEDILDANYSAQKQLIDHQNELMLYTWNNGVYFDAGMFYGRIWYLLAQGCMMHCEQQQ